jgi:hypothetical protein
MNNLKIEIGGLFLLLFVFADSLRAQNTDPLSYHTSRQLSDSSYSIKKANGDSTVFLFEGVGNSASKLPNLLNRNYPNDSTAVVDGGLYAGDFYRTGNIVKLVVDMPVFSYILDNSDGSQNSYQFRIDSWNSSNIFNLKVNWGDGTIDSTSYVGLRDYSPIHNYSPGIYTITVLPSDLSKPNEFYFNRNEPKGHISNINKLSILTSLHFLAMNNCRLTNTEVNNFIIPATVTTLSYAANGLTDFNPSTALPSNMDNFQIGSNNLTSFSPSVGLPATIRTLDLSYNKLTSSEVNNTLIWLDGLTFNAGVKTLNIRQYKGATPSGAGLTAKASLESKGWTITTD